MTLTRNEGSIETKRKSILSIPIHTQHTHTPASDYLQHAIFLNVRTHVCFVVFFRGAKKVFLRPRRHIRDTVKGVHNIPKTQFIHRGFP